MIIDVQLLQLRRVYRARYYCRRLCIQNKTFHFEYFILSLFLQDKQFLLFHGIFLSFLLSFVLYITILVLCSLSCIYLLSYNSLWVNLTLTIHSYQCIASFLDYSFLSSDYSELEEIISTFNDMPGLIFQISTQPPKMLLLMFLHFFS